jgi:hypothetical protein
LAKLWGSLGQAKLDLPDWKDWATANAKGDYYKLTLSSALDNVDYDAALPDDVEDDSDCGDRDFNDSQNSVSIRTNENDGSCSRTGGSTSSSVRTDGIPEKLIKGRPSLKKRFLSNTNRRLREIKKKSTKQVAIDRYDEIKQESDEILKSQYDPLELLCQLELHERLHVLYSAGKLRKCSLSFYITFMAPLRMRILHWLGSSTVSDDYEPPDEPISDLYVRLAKIPDGFIVLGDKGFEKTDSSYPFWNQVWTPIVLRGRNVKHL